MVSVLHQTFPQGGVKWRTEFGKSVSPRLSNARDLNKGRPILVIAYLLTKAESPTSLKSITHVFPQIFLAKFYDYCRQSKEERYL